MKTKHYLLLTLLALTAACSTTKHLPEGERLYVGLKRTLVDNPQPTSTGATALTEIEAAIGKAPNNSLFGSSYHRFPLPIGLWFYNGFQRYERGFGKWIFDRFASNPVLLSGVNPLIRQRV
ncbi:MAG: hypothetical protein LBL78_03145, partial [Prevotellaceae bacterium]|nr:hypothetical protein [Prevotellaceae bacterium]